VTGTSGLTEDQVYWLKALLTTRPRSLATIQPRQLKMPSEVSRALSAMGLLRSTRGGLEITLEGIREISRQPVPEY